MKIQREIIQELKKWKDRKNRKPLILKGTRQTGKTWIMREFGKQYFDFTAEFNFDKTAELAEIFERTKDVKRILNDLTLFTNVPVVPGKTLIIFDEIQESNGALNSLKYFCEDAPEYHIVAAGSLLGVSIKKKKMSVPVGKVEILNMRPVSFKEFLRKADETIYNYVEGITQIEPLPEIVFNRLHEEFRRYQICGGMPEAVVSLFENLGMDTVENVLQNILNLYTMDFSKYADAAQIARINNIWDSLPSQLAKENRKFIYKVVKTGARAREYEDALLWLEEAGLVYRVYNVSKPGIPLSAYRDVSAFKLYAFDCGILRRLAKLSPEILLSGHLGFTEFKGAIAENTILQLIEPQFDDKPYYWASGNKAEIDLLLQTSSQIIPVEIKSENRVSGKSLSVYNNKFAPEIRIRFSMKNLHIENGLINIPSFLADWAKRIIELS
ncbi:MAG: ATP-binding protein [Bacteroidales bacterium]|nr:ATP-binding protein [Bacteroidales bacterium]